MRYRLPSFLALLCVLAAPAAAQSGTLDKIRKTGVITMGYVEGSAPFSFSDASKQPQGYSVDLCRAIASGIRAQLKLQGIDANVQRVAVDEDVWHRVRIGPITDLTELNRLRARLRAAELDALVIRVGE